MPLSRRDLSTRLLRVRPLFTAAICFLIGCILQYALHWDMLVLASALIVLLLSCALLKKRKRLVSVLLMLCLLPLGALRFELGWRAVDPLPARKGVQLEGIIYETPSFEEENGRSVCVLDALKLDGEPVPGRIRLYLRGDAENPEDMLALRQLAHGQSISCSANIHLAKDATNPGQYSFSNRLRVLGLKGYATAALKDASLSAPKRLINTPIEELREAIKARIDRLFPESSQLVRAFVLGDRSEISTEERESFSKSGVAHLLAISGMHISALAAAINFLLSKLLKRSHASIITLALLLAYGVLVGFNPSVSRTLMMFAMVQLAAHTGRYSDAPTRLAAAALIYLMIRPVAIIDPSFILSYGASAGLILLRQPLYQLFRVEEIEQKRVASRLKRMLHALRRWALGILAASSAAQLTILPASVHFFGMQPLWSILLNIVCVPLAMFAYILSLIGLIIGVPSFAWPGDQLFHLLSTLVQAFSKLPLATLRIARFPIWLVILCVLVVLLSSELSRLPEKLRRFLPLLILPAVLVSNFSASLTTRGVSVVFLDAGQADCSVIRTEGKVYLVDTGDAYSPAADYLSAMNYTPDAIFLSHAHTDHAGGLQDILKLCVPGTIYLPHSFYAHGVEPAVLEALAYAQERGCELVMLSAGDEIQLSEKTFAQVCFPAAGILHDSANNDSMVLQVESKGGTVLYCGDTSASVLDFPPAKVNALKLAHHGSASALTPELIASLSPELTIISVGENSYGHPAPNTLELLEASGTLIQRTDEAGAITLYLHDSEPPSVETYLNTEDAG